MPCIGCHPEKTQEVLLRYIDFKFTLDDQLCPRHTKDLYEKIRRDQL